VGSPESENGRGKQTAEIFLGVCRNCADCFRSASGDQGAVPVLFAHRAKSGSISAKKNGGRDKDRTCDPYDVNVVLSR
jgi:hypothetical protein